MNDLISRKWLLDVVENIITWDTDRDRNLAIHHVRELAPSAQPEPQWIPVTDNTLPDKGKVVIALGEKGTWDFGTYRGHGDDIHYWHWKKNTFKRVYWWMYKENALPEPYQKR